MKLFSRLPHFDAYKKLACLFIAIALCIAPPVLAQSKRNAEQKPKISKAQAAQTAKRKVNGRILRVEQNQKIYRVKMLKKSGRVVSVDIDKRSGKVIETRKIGKDN